MGDLPALGIRRIEAIHYYVRDLERSRRFYTERLGFAEVGCSGKELSEAGRQRALVFDGGGCRVICSSPDGGGGRADRYLQKHPDGVGSLVFEVEDVARAFSFLEQRGATPIRDIHTVEEELGQFKTFLIATPFGGTTFRFIERVGVFPLYPGFDLHRPPRSEPDELGLRGFDHVTSNFETMSPALLWMEHVLGFERFWQVEFHTEDVSKREGESGSGLRSVVMWDPSSGVKFANNEPRRPNFRASQINAFHEQHRGDGVQHVAILTSNIVAAVRALKERGVEFMKTPAAYYDRLPGRLALLETGPIEESVEELRELEILVDGDGPGRYLLQIFMKDSAGVHGSLQAGPFFFELIARRGDSGFGAGNFRALFESIETAELCGAKR